MNLADKFYEIFWVCHFMAFAIETSKIKVEVELLFCGLVIFRNLEIASAYAIKALLCYIANFRVF